MRTKNRTATVTEAVAQAALRRGPAPDLVAEEEQVARMRLGAPLPRGATLERKAPLGSDLEIELLAFEIALFRRWRAHLETVRGKATSPAKAKIVGALGKKR